MNKEESNEILYAIRELNSRFDKLESRFDSFEKRFDGLEERVGSLNMEMRSGFEKIDTRLINLEEEVVALSKTVDDLIEGDTLGKRHIMLTREEYDAIVTFTKFPNRFA